MSDATHIETAPEDRIAIHHKLIYGLGAFVNNTLAAAIGSMIIVLNLGFGMSPALVGLLGALPRITDAITDPLMGYISDTTRSRWGRRRPYIFVGAILVGVIFALLWQLPVGKSENWYFWYFLGGSVIFYLAYTMYATPWVALGYELTPDYHERTRLMGTQNFIGNIAYLVSPYFLWIMYNAFDDVKDGAAGLAMIIAVIVIAVGVLPAIFLRERFQAASEEEEPTTEEAQAEASRFDAELAGLSPAQVEQRALKTFAGAEADYYCAKWVPDTGPIHEDAAEFSDSGFNWSALFLSVFWLIYRRMWVTLIVFVPSAAVLAWAGFKATAALEAAPLPAVLSFLAEWATSSLWVVPAIILGFMGNSLYHGKARKALEEARSGGQITGAGLQKIQASGGTIFRNMPGIEAFFTGFATTLRFAPFRKLCLATFLVFNGFILIASFQSYVIIYYVFSGDAQAGATFVGHSGLLAALTGFGVIIFVTWLATKIGKRRAFFVSTGVSMVGYCLKWFCYVPGEPWLVLIPAPLMAFGLAGLFTLMPSMVCDVVDMDELQTHERREGMYGSIFWWVVKVGQAVAIAGGGILLVATGFDVDLGGNQAPETIFQMRLFDAFFPAAASAVAIWAVASYSITEEKAHKIRAKLEARRGTG
ncbi:MAG: MFS transporter [Woeseiaceae bacterium]|nr:MFS transporter [Woeseiaceae bacterium]